MFDNNKAFTLVELVIVIVLLGILAATALPRFVDISEDAHVAKLKATLGAARSAMQLVEAKWFVSGQPTYLNAFAGSEADFQMSSSGKIEGAGLDVSNTADLPLAANEHGRCQQLLLNLVPDASVLPKPVDDCNAQVGTSFGADFCAQMKVGDNRCEYVYTPWGTSSNYYSLVYCAATTCNHFSKDLGDFFGFLNPSGALGW